jgi:NADPH-dependent glutamate synthase beta subunit-like oxidoreductase/formate hydrogenlyase subunit 6/NADH:ubiquinone oxidoreductase subunit I
MVMVKEKVLDLANKISRTKRGSKSEIRPQDPEYRILEPVVTDEMAEVALCLGLRQPRSAAEIAALCGKSLETTTALLDELALAGVCFVNTIDGVDKFWHDLWIPGHMEMMANNLENVKKYPQIAESFEAYGRVRGPQTTGNFPVGKGLMRVIPIEKTIEGETRRASYEEISKYLNDATLFSVSDCSCRTAREAMGEGCGHLKEDMCIQMGHAAEYYIRTGRGREVTREEAFEIIKRAEANGLMHQIPNTDGPGKTHAICNCCGCSCLSMRTASMFYNNDMVRSNYVSQVDAAKCVACGECVEVCPVNALKLGQKLCAKNPVATAPRETPRDTAWGPDRWNADYRTNAQVVADTGSSPCKAGCPAHIGIQGYIKKAAQGKYREALELIKKENPFPAVCGRVCPRSCESACTRNEIDEPLAVDEIKKFIAEQDLHQEHRFVPTKKHSYTQKIAVVGAGPAGLSCAYFLAVEGYPVTVFERQPVLGGMLTLGIPSYRLQKDVVNAEIDVLKELGVEFRTGVDVGRDVTLGELRSEGYRAFYLAVGAQNGRALGIEGENADGVVSGVDFLRRVNLGTLTSLSGPAVVVGGGNVAIDVARTALRLGASEVFQVCLEGRGEMPALAEEIHEAEDEGVKITNGWGPRRAVVENGQVVGVEFRRCTRVFDENRKFSPLYDDTDLKVIPASHVLTAVGQTIDWGDLLGGTQAKVRPNRTIEVDPATYQSAEPDVFAGGDASTGPRFAIDAIAQGKEAAVSLHRYVQPGQSLVLGRIKRDYRSFAKEEVNLEGYDRMPRQRPAAVPGAAAKATFADLRPTFTEAQVKAESERCLGCGATQSDPYLCVGCGACVNRCQFGAISLVRRYDEASVELKDLKPTIVRHVVKRQVKMFAKTVTAPVTRLFRRV